VDHDPAGLFGARLSRLAEHFLEGPLGERVGAGHEGQREERDEDGDDGSVSHSCSLLVMACTDLEVDAGRRPEGTPPRGRGSPGTTSALVPSARTPRARPVPFARESGATTGPLPRPALPRG